MAGKSALDAVEGALSWAFNGAKKIGKNFTSNGDAAGQSIFGTLKKTFDPSGAMRMNGDEVAGRMKKNLSDLETKNYDEAREMFPGQSHEDIMGVMDEVGKEGDALSKGISNIAEGTALDSGLASVDGKGGFFKSGLNYVTGADASSHRLTTAVARIGAVGAVAHVGGSAARGITGNGDSGYNSRGERDIAGIPFM